MMIPASDIYICFHLLYCIVFHLLYSSSLVCSLLCLSVDVSQSFCIISSSVSSLKTITLNSLSDKLPVPISLGVFILFFSLFFHLEHIPFSSHFVLLSMSVSMYYIKQLSLLILKCSGFVLEQPLCRLCVLCGFGRPAGAEGGMCGTRGNRVYQWAGAATGTA